MDNSFIVNQIKDKLIKLLLKQNVGQRRVPSIIMGLLSDLRKTPMTLGLLISTKIGLTLYEVVQKDVSEEVTEFAEQIVNEWKQLLPRKIEKRDKQNTKFVSQTNSLTINERNTAKPIIDICGKELGKTSHKVSDKKTEKASEIEKLDNKHLKNLNQSRAESTQSVKSVEKLPSIGQMPEFKSNQTSSKQLKSGNQIEPEIINKRKREQSSVARYDPIERSKPLNPWMASIQTFKATNERLSKNIDYKFENWHIPRSQPFMTGKDRLRIIQSRVDDPEQPTENFEE